jgi:acyl-CoA synthetase (AMP-forming)/AMP-acid ligase II
MMEGSPEGCLQQRPDVPEGSPAMNLASNLVHSAGAHADRVALRLGEAATTYREFDRDSARVAGLLRDRGMRPGDPAGIMLPNVPEFAALYYGVLRRPADVRLARVRRGGAGRREAGRG